MRNAVFIALLLTGLSACCKPEDCSIWRIRGMELTNFSAEDADSIAVSSFSGNAAFSDRIDSSVVGSNPYTGRDSSRIVTFPGGFHFDRDYRIRVLSTGDVFTLSNIQSRIANCGKCGFNKGDQMPFLISYTVNGKLVTGSYLLLNR